MQWGVVWWGGWPAMWGSVSLCLVCYQNWAQMNGTELPYLFFFQYFFFSFSYSFYLLLPSFSSFFFFSSSSPPPFSSFIYFLLTILFNENALWIQKEEYKYMGLTCSRSREIYTEHIIQTQQIMWLTKITCPDCICVPLFKDFINTPQGFGL